MRKLENKLAALCMALVFPGIVHAATYTCGVMAEEARGEYTRQLANKSVGETDTSVIFDDAAASYQVTTKKNGSITLSVVEPKSQEIQALASATLAQLVTVMDPARHRMMTCIAH